MSKFAMFQLCKEPDGYQVFYDYKKNRLYGCYTAEEEAKPNYGILLIQPFLILGLKIFCDWAVSLEIWGQGLMCLLALIIVTIMIQYFWGKLSKNTEEVRDSRMRELFEPMETEWEHFLNLGTEQLKRQMPYYLLVALGMAGSAIGFIWTRGFIFLGIYSLLYFIAYPFILTGRPIRKYRFIKNRRKEI